MNVKKAIAIHLLADATLKKIVSDRIYRGRLPANVKPPHIIIWLLSSDRLYDHDGYSGMTKAMLQISCFSYDTDEADTMAAAVRASLESWPAESGNVMAVFVEDQSDGFEQETLLHHVPLDVNISYKD